MRFRTILVLSVALLGCERSPAPLAALALDPGELPPSCRLAWRVRPLPLSTASAENREYFATLAAFWTGPGYSLAPAEVEAGLSNVYSSPDDESSVVVFSVRLKNPAAAVRLERHLRGRYGADTATYWVHRAGAVVSVSSRGARVPVECARRV